MSNKQPFAEFRKKAGLTIEAAACEFGVKRWTIMRWEKGSTKIPINRLEDAKRILNAPARELRPDVYEAVQ